MENASRNSGFTRELKRAGFLYGKHGKRGDGGFDIPVRPFDAHDMEELCRYFSPNSDILSGIGALKGLVDVLMPQQVLTVMSFELCNRQNAGAFHAHYKRFVGHIPRRMPAHSFRMMHTMDCLCKPDLKAFSMKMGYLMLRPSLTRLEEAICLLVTRCLEARSTT